MLELGLGVGCLILRFWMLDRGRKLGLISRYPIFFSFVLFSIASDLVLWGLRIYQGAPPTRTEQILYRNVYFAFDLLAMVFVVALLAHFYVRFKSERDTAAWAGMIAFTTIMTWFFAGANGLSTGSLYLVSKSTLLHFAVLFSLLLVGHLFLSRFEIGLSEFLIVLGVALNVTVQYLGWTLLTLQLVEYQDFRPWIVPMGFLPWLFLALAVRQYFPTQEWSPARLAGIRRQEADFAKAVKLLVRRS